MALNALGALLAAIEAGAPVDSVLEGLAGFDGVRRRFELVGEVFAWDDSEFIDRIVDVPNSAAKKLRRLLAYLRSKCAKTYASPMVSLSMTKSTSWR